jgi:hypothetical protein
VPQSHQGAIAIKRGKVGDGQSDHFTSFQFAENMADFEKNTGVPFTDQVDRDLTWAIGVAELRRRINICLRS